MREPAEMSSISEHATRDRLLELKHRLSDLKLEALRRGYGLEQPATSIDDLDTIVAEVTADAEQVRAERSARQSRYDDGYPASNRM